MNTLTRNILQKISGIFMICLLMSPTLNDNFVHAADGYVTVASSVFNDPTVRMDGWTGTNNAAGKETVSYQTSGGITGGYLFLAETQGDDALCFFAAPQKFLGNKRHLYNGRLMFSLRQNATGNWALGNDVRLQSGTNVLAYRFPVLPSTAWKRFEIPLNENVGWTMFGADRHATAAEIAAVLSSLDQLWIRAEYSANNSDRADLDEVIMEARPSGPLEPALSLTIAAGITITGAVGATYRIDFADALNSGSATGFTPLTEIILPVSPYFFADPAGFSGKRFYRAVMIQP